MPIYGYACTECGNTLDELQKVSDPPLVDCPACEKPALRRQLSAPRFRLKGQGWYETDFKKDKQRNIAGEKEPEKSADKNEDKKADKKTDGDKDKKPAAGADAKTGTPEKTGAKKA